MKIRRILSSISSLAAAKPSSSFSSSYFSSISSRQIYTSHWHRHAGSKFSDALPGNHIKWASLGSVRNSRFASGFTTLQPKPLNSIIDLERAKTKSPEELTSIWDDLSETKDLVFIRGDVVFTSKITDEEAKWIMETAQSFYLNDTRYKLVERFNKHTHDFDFKDVLQALDMSVLLFALSR